jgi:rhodanese-related sulfurtransferase
MADAGGVDETGAMTDLSPAEFSARLTDGAVLLDVREPWEAELASIPGATLIPLSSLPERVGELDPEKPVLIYCHHGMRSDRARVFLETRGFDAAHLAGGIDAWSTEIDPDVPRY